MKKTTPVISSALIISVLMTYWIFTTFFTAQSLTQAEVAILSPDWTDATGSNWSPWHTTTEGTKEWNPTASFNAWIETIPEHDKAWPTIARVLLDHEEIVRHEWLGTEPHETDEWIDTFLLFHRTDARLAVDDLVHAMHAPALGVVDREGTDPVTHELMIDRGMADPDWIENPSENPDPWTNYLGVLTQLRNVTNTLSTAAYCALESEMDTERYIDIVSGMFDGADLSLTRTRMIDHLVYFAVYRKNLSVMEWALVNHPDQFDEVDLSELDWILEAYPSKPFEATGQMLAIHDRYRRVDIRFGDIDADRISEIPRSWIPTEFALPSHKPIAKLDPRLQQIILYKSRQHRKIADKSLLPWDGTELGDDDYREGLDLIPVRMQEEANDSGFSLWYWEINLGVQLRTTALRIALAAERHKRRNGVYPQGIDHIDTDFIHFDINDPFTNEPLLYAMSYAGPIIYSAGTDRDDDDGTPMRRHYINPNYASKKWLVMSATDGSISIMPHWISREQAEGIEDQSLVDGDWILYPEPD